MQCANQSLLGEDVDQTSSLSKKLSMIAGARRHLEAGHEKYILDIIQSHPALVILSPILSFFYLGVGPFFVSTNYNVTDLSCDKQFGPGLVS